MISTKSALPHRVLILDNEDDPRAVIRRALATLHMPLTIFEVSSLKQARLLLRRQAPMDLAIVDVCLDRGARGLDLFGPRKPLDPWAGQTRIIVYTAFSEWQTVRTAYEGGASTFISKLEASAYVLLAKKARKLLNLREEQEDLRRQFIAQRKAEQAFRAHRRLWLRKYRGQFLLLLHGKIVAHHPTPVDVSQALGSYPEHVRPDIGVIEVRED